MILTAKGQKHWKWFTPENDCYCWVDGELISTLYIVNLHTGSHMCMHHAIEMGLVE